MTLSTESSTVSGLRNTTETARFNMIEQQIRPAEVLDSRVLNTIATTPREDFVPEQYRNLAFSDVNIPLPHGQVMMKPLMEARLLQALDIQPTDKILEIGTGSGYFTALLARLGGHVNSVDIEPDFIASARQKLDAHGITNVSLVEGDAARGWTQGGPYDAIAITGSLPILPDSFQQQLSVGGRMVAIIGQSPVMEALLITRVGENEWAQESLFETDFPALKNAEQPPAFHF
ncbi:MAG TPA: protein-L-isoaspartate O-methyltransferase [Gammaproteobacteria bacterium]|nr:protein-L-isoaspartate O-methyltransferase [Gammaproteobacteria bacterium]